MQYSTTQKEIVLLIGVAITLLIAGFRLFYNQPESKFAKAGASVLPSYTATGAGRCNIPNYESYRRTTPAASDSLSVNGGSVSP